LIRESGCKAASLTKIDRYEDLLEVDFASLADAAILVGGAELRSELVRVVGEQVPLLGASSESLASIRNPFRWLRVLQEAGCRVPQIQLKCPADYSTGDWLVKLQGSCGGKGVHDSYFQRRVSGQAWSALLVSRCQTENNASETFLLGCTRQWLAADFVDVIGSCSRQTSGRRPEVPQVRRPFAYRGSVGPLSVAKSVQQQVERVAKLLAKSFAMQGVWGIDFVLDAEGQVWPVDFNPRITASVELFESAMVQSESKFRSVLDLHLAACISTRVNGGQEFRELADDGRSFSGEDTCEAKRILFNSGPLPIGITNANWEQLSRYYEPSFFKSSQVGSSIADVPRLGDRIGPGHPLLTIRSRATTEAAAVALLDELFKAVQALVGEIG